MLMTNILHKKIYIYIYISRNKCDSFKTPKPLPTLISSNFVRKNGFQVVEALRPHHMICISVGCRIRTHTGGADDQLKPKEWFDMCNTQHTLVYSYAVIPICCDLDDYQVHRPSKRFGLGSQQLGLVFRDGRRFIYRNVC